jgi:lipopolysaccharide export system permease protein
VRRLDRYIASYFLSCYAVTFLFFVGLFIVVDLISSAEKFIQTAGEEHWSFPALAQRVVVYYLLYLPTIFLQVAPFMTVISGIAAVARLRKNNEVIPIVMAGCSTFRMLVPVFALAVLLTITMVAVQERVAPKVASLRIISRATLRRGDEGARINPDACTDEQGRLWFLAPLELKSRHMESADVTWAEENAGARVVYWITAKGLTYDPVRNGWSVENGSKTTQIAQGELPPAEEKIDFIPGGPVPEDLLADEKSPYDLSVTEIAHLAVARPNPKWSVLFHHHLTFPLTNVLLLLLGIPFVLRHEDRNFFLNLAKGAFVCILYFVADIALRNLGARGALDPRAAAWIPVIFFGSLGVCLFDSIRT